MLHRLAFQHQIVEAEKKKTKSEVRETSGGIRNLVGDLVQLVQVVKWRTCSPAALIKSLLPNYMKKTQYVW